MLFRQSSASQSNISTNGNASMIPSSLHDFDDPESRNVPDLFSFYTIYMFKRYEALRVGGGGGYVSVT